MLAAWIGVALAGSPAGVRAAITSGDCDQALALAREIEAENPDDGEAVRLVGDAWRCSVDASRALAAYRRALLLGAATARHIEDLQGSVARMVVTVEGVDPTREPPELVVVRGDQEIAAWSAMVPAWRFRDLPVGEALTLEIRRSDAPVRVVDLPAIEKGDLAEHTLRIDHRPLGTLTVPAWETNTEVWVTAPGEAKVRLEPGAHLLPAGDLIAELRHPFGTATYSVIVAPAGRATLPVDVLVPGKLSITGLPDQAEVSVGDHQLTANATNEDLDPLLGVRVAPAQGITLAGGAYRVELTSALLGAQTHDVDIRPGKMTTLRAEAGAFPRATELRVAYSAWQARRERTPAGVVGGAAATGAALVTSVVAAVVLGGEQRRVNDAWAAYEAAHEQGNIVRARLLYGDIAPALRRRTGPGVALGVGLGGVVIGGTFTGLRAGGWRRQVNRPWDPQAAIGPVATHREVDPAALEPGPLAVPVGGTHPAPQPASPWDAPGPETP